MKREVYFGRRLVATGRWIGSWDLGFGGWRLGEVSRVAGALSGLNVGDGTHFVETLAGFNVIQAPDAPTSIRDYGI